MAFMKEKDLGDLVILGLIFHSDNALAKNAILINLCKNSLSLILSLSLSLSLILTLTSACTIFLSRLSPPPLSLSLSTSWHQPSCPSNKEYWIIKEDMFLVLC